MAILGNCEDNSDTVFRQHAASIYGFVHKVSYVCQKKKLCVCLLGFIVGASSLFENLCQFVGLHCGCVPPLWKNMCVRSLGYIVGVSPPLCVHSIANTVGASPLVCVLSSLDPCMLPTPLCGIFKHSFDISQAILRPISCQFQVNLRQIWDIYQAYSVTKAFIGSWQAYLRYISNITQVYL